MNGLSQDLRFAIRGAFRQPGLTFTILAVMAVGIGAMTGIFTLVRGILLRPLPYSSPEQLVVVLQKQPSAGSEMPVAPGNYYDLQSANRSFSSLGAAELWSATLTGDGPAEQVNGLKMSAEVFAALGTNPKLGRVLEKSDETTEARSVVLGHQLWQRRFGADRSIIGRKIVLTGEAFEVAGVMPPEFRFPPFWATKAELYVPLSFRPERKVSRGGNSLRLFGRLKPGVTIEQAQADLESVGARLREQHPVANRTLAFSVRSLHAVVVGRVEQALVILLGGVGLLLLIACANVANLLLVRSLGRTREFAVRVALGSSPWRIVRQLLVESLLLSVTAGMLGVFAAVAIVDLVQHAFRTIGTSRFTLPRLHDVALDTQVLLFALTVSVLTGVLFGLAPVLQRLRQNGASMLRQGRGVVAGSSGARSALVAAEVALSVVLLAGAGLLAKSFYNLIQVDPGFQSERVLTAEVRVVGSSVSQPERQIEFYRTTLDRLGKMPGVESVAAINHLPLSGDEWGTRFTLTDRPKPLPGEEFRAVYRVISPEYFKTMGARVVEGREFRTGDSGQGTRYAVVNHTLARRFWPSGSAIGKRIALDENRSAEIVGVVQDVKQQEWTRAPEPEIYLCYLQQPEHFAIGPASAMTFVLRAAGDPLGYAPAIRKLVADTDSRIPVTSVSTLAEVVDHALAQPRLYSILLGFFALSGLLLAALGIYGVIAFSVAQRRQELGVRMALGASSGQITGMVFGSGARLVIAGILAGGAAYLAIGRFLQNLLFGVMPYDSTTLSAVVALLLAIAGLAIYVPARRVVRIDPAGALKTD